MDHASILAQTAPLTRTFHCGPRSSCGGTRLEATSTLSDCVHTRGLASARIGVIRSAHVHRRGAERPLRFSRPLHRFTRQIRIPAPAVTACAIAALAWIRSVASVTGGPLSE